MKIRNSRLSALVAAAACVLGSGAGMAQSDVEQRAANIKIYALGEINVDRYEVVGRPLTDTWRSAFWLPTHPTREQAVAALQTDAARRGAPTAFSTSTASTRVDGNGRRTRSLRSSATGRRSASGPPGASQPRTGATIATSASSRAANQAAGASSTASVVSPSLTIRFRYASYSGS